MNYCLRSYVIRAFVIFYVIACDSLFLLPDDAAGSAAGFTVVSFN